MIYLDHNATTPLLPEALSALAAAARAGGNPSSLHQTGQAARRTLEAAQQSVRRLVGAPEDADVVLTGGGTEADNLAMAGLAAGRPGAVVLSELEHPAVAASAARLGRPLRKLPIGADGRVDPAAVALGADTALVAIMLANNETGVLQPVAELGARAAAAGVPLHVDAVQAAGKVPIDMQALGATTLAIAGHKLGGPRGVGALVILKGTRLMPLWQGGGQQAGLRSGTPPVALAAALGVAAVVAARHAASHERVLALRDRLEEQLVALPGAFVIARGAPRLPNTCAIGFAGVPSGELVARLDALGVAVSAGAACHAGESRASAVLLAMGIDPARALEVVRLSLGAGTTAREVDAAAARVIQAVQELRR